MSSEWNKLYRNEKYYYKPQSVPLKSVNYVLSLFYISTLLLVTPFLLQLNSLDYIFTFLQQYIHTIVRHWNSLLCADVPLRIYSLTQPLGELWLTKGWDLFSPFHRSSHCRHCRRVHTEVAERISTNHICAAVGQIWKMHVKKLEIPSPKTWGAKAAYVRLFYHEI